MNSQRLKMLLQIGKQQLQSAPVMVMRHDPSRDSQSHSMRLASDHRQAFLQSTTAMNHILTQVAN
jgi:hypothetical protein